MKYQKQSKNTDDLAKEKNNSYTSQVLIRETLANQGQHLRLLHTPLKLAVLRPVNSIPQLPQALVLRRIRAVTYTLVQQEVRFLHRVERETGEEP